MKNKYVVEHYVVTDEIDGTMTESFRGVHTTYAESEEKAISNIRYRLGISLVPYDTGFDKSGWHELRVKK